MQDFSFNTVPNIQFGVGISHRLAEFAHSLGMTKTIIITDSDLVELGLLNESLANFTEPPIVYSGVKADPPEECVFDAISMAQGCDGVIGFGGGSSLDVAKLVAVLVNNSQSLQECYGVDQISGQRLPLIQVPTTAGTGSEVTAVAIITTGEVTKAGAVSSTLLADIAVLDPALTVGLPAFATAATGIDAMVHAIEAYTSVRLKNPISDMLAVRALSLMSNSLSRAVLDGQDIQARSNMLLGSMYAGQAFANAPVAAVHALAYPLGGIYHITHGLSNSLVLPHVLRFNSTEVDHWYAELAEIILGEPCIRQAAYRLADYFLAMAQEFSLPLRLSDLDISENSLPELAEHAMLQTRLLINNPREVSFEDALAIYQAAY